MSSRELTRDNYPLELSVYLDDGEVIIGDESGREFAMHPMVARALASELLDRVLELQNE